MLAAARGTSPIGGGGDRSRLEEVVVTHSADGTLSRSFSSWSSISEHYLELRARPPSSIVVIGQTLYRGCRLDGAAGTVSRYRSTRFTEVYFFPVKRPHMARCHNGARSQLKRVAIDARIRSESNGAAHPGTARHATALALGVSCFLVSFVVVLIMISN
jgi:hypothetical protein